MAELETQLGTTFHDGMIDEQPNVLEFFATTLRASLPKTANPTMLTAGYKRNVAVSTAEAVIDGRVLPGTQDDFVREVTKIVGPGIDIEWTFGGRVEQTTSDGCAIKADLSGNLTRFFAPDLASGPEPEAAARLAVPRTLLLINRASYSLGRNPSGDRAAEHVRQAPVVSGTTLESLPANRIAQRFSYEWHVLISMDDNRKTSLFIFHFDRRTSIADAPR